jgi:hypothetical protein
MMIRRTEIGTTKNVAPNMECDILLNAPYQSSIVEGNLSDKPQFESQNDIYWTANICQCDRPHN